jgi:hypothetical protein
MNGLNNLKRNKMEKETIEEAAEKYAKQFDYAEDSSPYNDFIEGGKWRQEQDKSKYSEEDIKSAYNEGAFAQLRYRDGEKWVDSNEWFEQFKNK